ncbi:exosporium leader peptide-containing protein [Bacillus wiedmannii]|uniref:Exosporium-targeted protein n=1 Tax=Bacillus thuringiensis TaxID=1428 RepID=A0A4R4B133_BACTU|nr:MULTISPECIES: exosporium leader peptide-containing protein [Bacillus cereus group]MED2040254.1 exosporium leader peptide-containing protein [Bacillus wiedmannii]TCW46853.1 exosporium-targeted protein [Bacillus thuringiensis]TCW47083.1 exosporium-targeted protein [Bacillus thuringiensis]
MNEKHEFLIGTAFDSNLLGPTLPPIPPFTLPTGPTGATGPTGVTPVFGMLNTDSVTDIPTVANTSIDFTVTGPFSGVILNTADNSITVGSADVYAVTFSTGVSVSGEDSGILIMNFTINDTVNFLSQIRINLDQGNRIMASKTILFSLNQGDVLRVLIRLSAGPVFIGEASFNSLSLFTCSIFIYKETCLAKRPC